MKRIFLLFILISGICFGQFTVTDILTVTKLSREQMEAKYNITSESKKTDKQGTHYMYSVNDMDAEWKLVVTDGKDKINKAVLITMNSNKNTLFAKFSNIFRKFITSRELVLNSTKTITPYFTAEEFRDAYYGSGKDGDAETLKTKTAILKAKADASNFTFTNNSESFSIMATAK